MPNLETRTQTTKKDVRPELEVKRCYDCGVLINGEPKHITRDQKYFCSDQCFNEYDDREVKR